jgi:hypothetical protein
MHKARIWAVGDIHVTADLKAGPYYNHIGIRDLAVNVEE